MQTTPRPFRACPVGLALAALLVLAVVCPAQAQEPAQAAPEALSADRAIATAPVRHVLVKAMGQGATPKEAEAQAVRNARALAAERLKALGGENALFPGEASQRIVSLRHFPAMGFSPARAVLLLELRLRGQAEPTPSDAKLLTLRATVQDAELSLMADRPCEAAVLHLPAGADEPEFLPGGTQVLRLTPGRSASVALPHGAHDVVALGCTGGLALPADPATVNEALTKARAGRPRPAQLEGVVSDCVELRLDLGATRQRSMRLKGPDTPVNMTGAAGRDAGLPDPPAATAP
jgi:hypothetical protein